jgi:hypothetical protein
MAASICPSISIQFPIPAVDGEIAIANTAFCAYTADRHLRDLKATGKSELASAGVRCLLAGPS